MGRLDSFSDLLGRIAATIAAVILVLITLHVLLEIVLRNLFGTSTYVLDEMVGYGVGAMTFLAMAHTFRRGEMIRVHLLIARLQGRWRVAVEFACTALTLAGFLLVLLYFGRSVLRNWRENTVSASIAEVPQWVPESLLVLGLSIFCLQLITYLARLLAGGDVIAGSNVTSE